MIFSTYTEEWTHNIKFLIHLHGGYQDAAHAGGWLSLQGVRVLGALFCLGDKLVGLVADDISSSELEFSWVVGGEGLYINLAFM